MSTQARIQAWLDGPYPEEMKAAIRKLQKENPQELNDAFFKDLSFGTGGMRGIMGVGTNRMNRHTIAVATQGLANYLGKKGRVFIGYDVRNHSREFAEEAASVLAGNGIEVLLASDICPTPLVSFACRHFNCSAAIMITASHNPPKYNGYKVYWNDGGQVVPPHDTGIIAEVRKIKSPLDIFRKTSWKQIGPELDDPYLRALQSLQLTSPSPLKILYTNLHGTGLRLMQKALAAWGYTDLHFVEKQKTLDGNFPFAPSPNPEEEKALELGTQQLIRENRDILLATDPDADRIGLVVNHRGLPVRLNGNQIACLCLQHISEHKKIPPNSACIKTIVTTELFAAIAKKAGLLCYDVLTGFKYIGELIHKWEQENGPHFLFGAEESYGYLSGTFVRDKDAISTACLIAEAAAQAKKQNLTLVDKLEQIYQTHGLYKESLTNLSFPDTEAGMQQMQALMQKLRNHPPHQIGDEKVLCIEDYTARTRTFLHPQKTEPLKLPTSDVLRFWLSNGSKLVIRPSGTEPKVKIYSEVKAPFGPTGPAEERLRHLVESMLHLS